MKKICGTLLLILVLTLSFNACNKTEQGGSIEQIKVSVTDEPDPSTNNVSSTSNINIQSPAPKSTTNVGSKDDLSTIIDNLNEELKSINNKKLAHNERVGMTTRFIENLTRFLQKKETTKLSDEDLQKALNYSIVSKTKVQNIDENNLRIVRFDGLPELFGTLERKWTLIQWWNGKEIHAQIIINKGAEVVEDFLVSNTKGVPIVTLAGYLTMYKPFPAFLSTWQLSDNKWSKTNLFSKNIASNDVWGIEVADNKLTVVSKSKDVITVEMNKQKDGFVVYSEADPKKEIEFKLDGEEIIVVK